MKVVITGGGTGGSITPLLAMYQELKKRDNSFLFIGGRFTIEKDFAEENGIPFHSIASGKLRRYLDLSNLLAPIFVLIGFFQALYLLIKNRPNVVIAAGSFVSVPVIWASWLLKIPALIHQLDIKKGLANALMAPFATRITVTFPSSLKDFSRKKTVLTGNPVRDDIFLGTTQTAYQIFNLKKEVPTLLILGGGTGALAINKIVNQSLSQLISFCQIIHIAGKGKNIFQNDKLKETYRPQTLDTVLADDKDLYHKEKTFEHYHVYEFLSDELKHAVQVADLVVTRAGISTLTELAALEKPLIIIPLPNTHQEENAKYFERENAALILNQHLLTPELFTNFIHDLLRNKAKRDELSANIKKLFNPDAAARITNEIYKIGK